MLGRLSKSDDLDLAWFLAEDDIPDRRDASSARLLLWDGSSAIVEHDGPCDLVIARTYDPGWTAQINGGLAQPVLPVDGGFLAVRLEGSRKDRITLRYLPARFRMWIAISLLAAAVVAIGLLAGLVSWIKTTDPAGSTASSKG